MDIIVLTSVAMPASQAYHWIPDKQCEKIVWSEFVLMIIIWWWWGKEVEQVRREENTLFILQSPLPPSKSLIFNVFLSLFVSGRKWECVERPGVYSVGSPWIFLVLNFTPVIWCYFSFFNFLDHYLLLIMLIVFMDVYH